MTTYRINTPVGTAARWLPSIEAAKEAYVRAEREAWLDGADDQEPEPSLTFEESTQDEDGQPAPAHVRCLRDGRWDCTIMDEAPEWPTYVLGHGTSPDLVMVTSGRCTCESPRLVCSNSCTPQESQRGPCIRCDGCGCTWKPEQS